MKLALALALVGSATATLYSAKPETQKYLFENFKNEHNKNYATKEEEAHRFEVFVSNLKTIDERNELEKGTAVHGITKFADLTKKEFKTSYLNYKPNPNRANRTMATGIKPLLAGETASNQGLDRRLHDPCQGPGLLRVVLGILGHGRCGGRLSDRDGHTPLPL